MWQRIHDQIKLYAFDYRQSLVVYSNKIFPGILTLVRVQWCLTVKHSTRTYLWYLLIRKTVKNLNDMEKSGCSVCFQHSESKIRIVEISVMQERIDELGRKLSSLKIYAMLGTGHPWMVREIIKEEEKSQHTKTFCISSINLEFPSVAKINNIILARCNNVRSMV